MAGRHRPPVVDPERLRDYLDDLESGTGLFPKLGEVGIASRI